MTPEERDRAKRLCYGILYGAGPPTLAKQMGVSVSQAQRHMERFLDK